jgi:hypothetical protein
MRVRIELAFNHALGDDRRDASIAILVSHQILVVVGQQESGW